MASTNPQAFYPIVLVNVCRNRKQIETSTKMGASVKPMHLRSENASLIDNPADCMGFYIVLIILYTSNVVLYTHHQLGSIRLFPLSLCLVFLHTPSKHHPVSTCPQTDKGIGG